MIDEEVEDEERSDLQNMEFDDKMGAKVKFTCLEFVYIVLILLIFINTM